MSKEALTLSTLPATKIFEQIPAEYLEAVQSICAEFPVKPYDKRKEAREGTDSYICLSTSKELESTLSISSADGSKIIPIVKSTRGSALAHVMVVALMTRKAMGINYLDLRSTEAISPDKMEDFEKALNFAYDPRVDITPEGYLTTGADKWLLNPSVPWEYETEKSLQVGDIPSHIKPQVAEALAAAMAKYDLTANGPARFDGRVKVAGVVDEEVVTIVIGDYTLVWDSAKNTMEVSYTPGKRAFAKGGVPDNEDLYVSLFTNIIRKFDLKGLDPKLLGNNPPKILTPEEQLEEDFKNSLRAELASWNRF